MQNHVRKHKWTPKLYTFYESAEIWRAYRNEQSVIKSILNMLERNIIISSRKCFVFLEELRKMHEREAKKLYTRYKREVWCICWRLLKTYARNGQNPVIHPITGTNFREYNNAKVAPQFQQRITLKQEK